MHEKPTNATIIHSVYLLCIVAPTCFGITFPSSGSVRYNIVEGRVVSSDVVRPIHNIQSTVP
jgi:hypothetical protein